MYNYTPGQNCTLKRTRTFLSFFFSIAKNCACAPVLSIATCSCLFSSQTTLKPTAQTVPRMACVRFKTDMFSVWYIKVGVPRTEALHKIVLQPTVICQEAYKEGAVALYCVLQYHECRNVL